MNQDLKDIIILVKQEILKKYPNTPTANELLSYQGTLATYLLADVLRFVPKEKQNKCLEEILTELIELIETYEKHTKETT